MIHILMFDLGNTLLREADRTPFPGAVDALRSLARLTADDGSAVELCLASNFPAHLPVPADQQAESFTQFLAILSAAGLLDPFRPAERRVTTSGLVGVAKPERAFFTAALARLGRPADLTSVLFVTEDAAHVARAREFGMTALRFGGQTTPPDATADFTDWADAPAVIAARLGPTATAAAAAVRAYLEHSLGLRVNRIAAPAAGEPFQVQAEALVPLAPTAGRLAGVRVPVPVQPQVWMGTDGRVSRVEGAEPDPEAVAEAAQSAADLLAGGRVAGMGNVSPLGPLFALEHDDHGRPTLTRKRFTY